MIDQTILNEFSKKWYWQEINEVMKFFSMTQYPPHPDFLSDHHGVKAGTIIGASTDIRQFDLKKYTILGGPCINDCKENITLEAVYEISNTLLLAKKLNSRAVIYIQDGEEALLEPDVEWKPISTRVHKLVSKLAKIYDYKNFIIVKTLKPENKSIIDLNSTLSNNFSDFDFLKMYAIKYPVGQPKNDFTEFEKGIIAMNKRTFSLYFPNVVKEFLGEKFACPILAAENLQQLKIIKLARIVCNMNGQFETEPHQVVHFPFPSLSGDMRMYRSEDKFYLTSDSSKIKDKNVLSFWSNAFPEQLTEKKEGKQAIENLLETLRE
jgi:hypothetical protein